MEMFTTPEEIVEAYEVTDFIPVQSTFFRKNNDGTICACALSTLYAHRKGKDKLISLFDSPIYDEKRDFFSEYQNEFSVSNPENLENFYRGFDGLLGYEPRNKESEEYQYFKLGYDAREAVKNKYTELKLD